MPTPTTRYYTTYRVSAEWAKCKTCGQLADLAIELNVKGRNGRKGSRTLGYFCQAHGDEKLKALRGEAAP